MKQLDRREFIRRAAAIAGAAFSGTAVADVACCDKSSPLKAADVVKLGRTKLTASRLNIGTGSMGGSEQRKLGIDGMVKLFRGALDEGVNWWDTADTYKTHPHIAAAMKEIHRDKIVVTTKTRHHDYDSVKSDIDRFRQELDTDYVDVCLLHCLTDPKWPEQMKGPMDALSEAKEKGHVRAIGCSCHALEALATAADTEWVDVVLARINPFAVRMDINRPDEVSEVIKVLQRFDRNGKGVYGMKILGEGSFKGAQIDESLRFVLHLPFVHAFTIGFGQPQQVDDIIRRIDALKVRRPSGTPEA